MPCMGPDTPDERIQKFEKQAKAASRAACELARVFREYPQAWRKAKFSLSPETLLWVERHDAADRARERRETRAQMAKLKQAENLALAADARKKLTARERKALGI